MPSLSALMTVYHRIDPAELAAALQSLTAQTRPADEVVIVEDGPIGDPLREIIDAFVAATDDARVVRLPENLGSGPASQAGLETILSDFTARLDADDVAHPERFATQLAYVEAHPETDVLGTAVAEFEHSPGDGQKVRALPETHEEIATYALINSPINNPSVMLRTERADRVGGYRDVPHMEDYDLYARLLADGARFHNLPEPLTYFRTSTSQFERRTKGMFAAERQMQRNLVSYGLISRPRAVFNLVARTAYRLLPTGLLTRVYGALFHK
ncbi:glycosyl transferase family protein [Corynebacterium maris DSM 45190]|uniref:Glycosyl transferase family protein n=1 Tax=Corynebacterium maris DSM 45190 TaxID=1224163 RepID=S5TGN7_9CORY|nr:glycosyltransferase [Corynebacterium maris]AGS33838.1 glycosyl transferase family protein [Corynebacterium maris DSM 45190]